MAIRYYLSMCRLLMRRLSVETSPLGKKGEEEEDEEDEEEE